VRGKGTHINKAEIHTHKLQKLEPTHPR